MDLMSQIMALIKPELLIVAVACYVVGLFLKNIPTIKDWLIPFILLGFAIILTILYMALVLGQGFTAPVIILGFIQGLLCAAVAVYGNELLKQAFTKRPEDTGKYN